MSHCCENVIKKVKVSDRTLLFQHAFVLGVYSMLTDRCCCGFDDFVSNQNGNLFGDLRVRLAYQPHSRRKLMALQRN